MAETRAEHPLVTVDRPAAQPQAIGGVTRAGIAGGLLSGAAMLAWLSANAALEGFSPARPLALAGAAFSDGTGAVPILTGLLLWAAVSMVAGLLFAMVVPHDFPYGSAALMGVGWSFLVLALMASVAMPRFNPEMRAGVAVTGGAWVLACVAWGLVLGFVPALRRRFAARAARPLAG